MRHRGKEYVTKWSVPLLPRTVDQEIPHLGEPDRRPSPPRRRLRLISCSMKDDRIRIHDTSHLAVIRLNAMTGTGCSLTLSASRGNTDCHRIRNGKSHAFFLIVGITHHWEVTRTGRSRPGCRPSAMYSAPGTPVSGAPSDGHQFDRADLGRPARARNSGAISPPPG